MKNYISHSISKLKNNFSLTRKNATLLPVFLMLLFVIANTNTSLAQDTFETSFDSWVNIAGDQSNWLRTTGSTPSPNTGPTTGSGSATYIYYEATGGTTGDVAWIEKVYDFRGKENVQLVFDFHMWANSLDANAMGSLDVFVDYEGTLTNVFTITGNQGNNWLRTNPINLSYFDKKLVKLRFQATRGTQFTSDIAVDNINVTFQLPGPLDSDGDGVLDINDLDDDNDGILDVDECQSISGAALPEADAISYSRDIYDFYVAGNNTNALGYKESGFEKAAFDKGVSLTVLSGPDEFTVTGATGAGSASNSTVSFANGTITYGVNYSSPTNNDEFRTTTASNFFSGNIGEGVYILPYQGGQAGDTYTTTINFTTPVTAFSFDLVDIFDTITTGNPISTYSLVINGVEYVGFTGGFLGDDGTGNLNVIDGSGTNVGSVVAGQNIENTIGFISQTPITQIQVIHRVESGSISSTARDPHGIDNFVYGTGSCDTDGDGILNYLDTDSDNDGCTDANEAYFGTTLRVDGDNDGFYGNGAVTVDGQGRVVGASYNTPNAVYLDETLSACYDTDNDGVPDSVDLDDDNDGILDSIECPLTPLSAAADASYYQSSHGRYFSVSNNINANGYIESGWSGAISEAGSVVVSESDFTSTTFSNGSLTISSDVSAAANTSAVGISVTNADSFISGASGSGYSIVPGDSRSETDQNLTTSVFINFTNPVYSFGFDLVDYFDHGSVGSFEDEWGIYADGILIFKIGPDKSVGSGVSGLVTLKDGSGNFLSNITVGQNLETFIGFIQPRPVSTIEIRHSSTYITDSFGADNFGIDEFRYSQEAPCDFDKDGIPNYLDSDSDNDGCTDADEAYYNGLADADSDNNGYYGSGVPTVDGQGKVTTASYATPNAYYLNTAVITCDDNDKDGIPDAVDVDDDNDGILDANECPTPVIYNDSFEVPNIQSLGTNLTSRPDADADGEVDMFISQTSIEGWTTTDANSFDIIFDLLNASDGNQSLDLYGTPTATGIQKTYTGFTEGVEVDFSLDYSSVAGLFEATVSVDYGSGPVLLTTLQPNGIAASDSPGVAGQRASSVVWSNYSATLTPTASGSIKIIIQSTSLGSGQVGVLIDNVSLSQTSCTDTDSDGVIDSFDTDSDNDGCPDAMEGAATLTLDKLSTFTGGSVGGSSQNLGSNVDANGSPIVSGQGATGFTQASTNDVKDANVSLACAIDLNITKKVDKPILKIGETVIFTLVLTNAGPQPATNVQVRDLLPAGLTYNAASSVIATNTTYNPTTGIWDLSSLTIGVNDSVELKIAATINTLGVIITNNTEIFSTTETDKDSTPNSNN
ncbi:hypothetical protein [Polaribacter sp. OB-PA-B3]